MQRATVNNAIFFLCDLQERFKPLVQNSSNVLRVASRMIEAGRILNIPLVVTEQNSAKLGKIVPELDVSGAAFFADKMRFSMVTPELGSYLRQVPDRRSVVIFGLEAHVCILQTVCDLLEDGYEVTVLADGTTAQRPHDVKLAFDQMRAWGASIVTSESLLFRLMRSADYEKFRQISALVKDTIPYSHI